MMATPWIAALILSVGVGAGAGTGQAPLTSFTDGPLIEGYGHVTSAPGATSIPPEARFDIAFDVAKAATPGTPSRALNSGARFLNMHAKSGVPAEQMSLAFVIHGPAVFDVVTAPAYARQHEPANASAPLVAALIENGVRVIVCGQSAAHQGVAAEDLLPGVEMALSAMTAHALLQQEGYTLNPF